MIILIKSDPPSNWSPVIIPPKEDDLVASCLAAAPLLQDCPYTSADLKGLYLTEVKVAGIPYDGRKA